MPAMRLSLSFAVVLASCGGSEVTAPPVDAPRAPAAPRADWRSAEAGITAADMRTHVAVLADYAMSGRETFTDGAKKAADYLAALYAQYGLEKLPGQSSYLVEYTLDEHGWDAAGSALTWKRGASEKTLRAGVDFHPLRPTDEGKTMSGELVFAGYGLDLPKKGWNDYAGLDVKGKVVLVLRHIPKEKERLAAAKAGGDRKAGKGELSSSADGSFVDKAKFALERGAVGMIVVTEPSHEFDETISLVARRRVPPTAEEAARDLKRREGLAARMKSAMDARPKGVKAAVKDRPFVSALLTRAAAEELLAGSGHTLASLQQAVDAGVKPKALRIGGVRASLSARSAEAPRKVSSHNVVGLLPGSDPALRDQWVVIGGHYDHVGEGGLDGDRIHNGADDNASGISGLLEMAQAFASLPAASRPARTIVFAAFSAEEMGLLGSDALLAESDVPAEKVVFMLNLDMIGRNPDKKIEILGDAFATQLKEVTEEANAGLGVDFEWSGLSYSAASDHHSFFRRHVPSMFFFTGTHEDYHQPGDHPDKLAYERMEKLARLGYRITANIASAPVAPRFIHQLLWLGITVEMVEGAPTVTAVSPGSHGETAGLAKGDVFTTIDKKPIASARALDDAFEQLEPGSAAAVVIRRGDTTVNVELRRAKPGYLGIMPGNLTDEQRKRLGLPEEEGLLIGEVFPGTPAEKSGLKGGDVLIRLGGKSIGSRNLFMRLAALGAGERVIAVVVRGGERVELDLTLGERPSPP
jgi:aminopeptidase YwaD